MRVILHAGFHKTGTTTVQQALRRNRAMLKPHLRVLLRPRMVAACEAARGYSASGDALDLALFQYEIAQLAEGWGATDPRPLLLASEDLAGHMPGRHGLRDYRAAPALMRGLAETIEAVLPGAEMVFYFSTRAAQPWLASCHAQHLAASRMTLDAGDYAARYGASADLDGVVDLISAAVAPWPVHRAALEASGDRALGPLDPLLDVVGLPEAVRRELRPQPPANTRPSADRLAALLEINRSELDDRSLAAAKRALPPKAP